MSKPTILAILALISLMLSPIPINAAVSVSSGKGKRLNGAVAHDKGDRWEIEIYRSFRKMVPKDGIQLHHFADPLQETRKQLTTRQEKLRKDDRDGRLQLAAEAAKATLSIQAAILLHEAAAIKNDEVIRNALRALHPPSTTTLPEALAAAKAFLSEPDNKTLRQALSDHDHIDAHWIPQLRRELWDHFKKGPTLTHGDGKLTHPLFTGDVHVERFVRPNAAQQKNDTWPLVLSLHGGGLNSGHWKNFGPTARKLFSKHLDRFILVAPTVLEKKYAEWAANPLEEVFVFRAIDAVKRAYTIDTNRVFIAGYSMGGYGTWHYLGHRADIFAGGASGAGGILIGTARGETWGWGIIGNLRHTPIAFCHGGKDRPAPAWSDQTADRILGELATKHPNCYRREFHFYPDKGHSLPGKAMANCVAFIAKNIRNPRPADLSWEPKRDYNRQFAWLYLEEPRCFTRVEARLAGNRIDLELLRIDGGLSILLDADLVDLNQPVEICVDGKRVFHGLPRPSLKALAESIADRFDPHLTFTHRIDL